jgi:nucleoside-diphosphate-sugar epimerase
VRVFVAGASGVIGRPLVRQLVEAGHEVTGATRRQERAEAIRAAGAKAAIVDVLDADAVRAAVGEAAPEVVINELTDLPARFNPRAKSIYEGTNRLRIEGTRNLLGAAPSARHICQSIAFAYLPGAQAEVKDEEAPLALGAPPPFGEGVKAIQQMETMVVDDEPARQGDWLPFLAETLGAKKPRRAPIWLARLVAGKMVTSADFQPGASNAKAKRELGWEPRWKSWREGFREAPR